MSDLGQHIPGMPRTLSEPVPKEVRDAYVAADNDLFWLADHGLLRVTALFLRNLRRENEQEQELTARLEAARDAAKARA